ncbi:MAG: glycosyltransferase [Acidobacteria bacterium]|nr:MAG: glycosyltransferase [Acidobacteriota bacterium]
MLQYGGTGTADGGGSGGDTVAPTPAGVHLPKVGAQRGPRRRLVLLIGSLWVGGAERQLVTLAQHLDQSKFEVILVTYRAVPPGMAQFPAPAGVRHVQAPSSRRNVLALALVLRRLQATWIYSFLPGANLRLLLCRPLLGGVHLVCGMRSTLAPEQLSSQRERVLLRFEWGLQRWADAVVSNSEAGRRLLLRATQGKVKARVVYNGIDTERFRPNAAAGLRVRQQWGIPAGAAVVGIISRLDPVKNHTLFLQAAAQMPPDVHFLCVGGGKADYAQALRAQAQRLGLGLRMHFVGERTDLEALYSSLNLCTLSSDSEGFPNSLGEAMACEVPCVGTDVGDTTYLVGDTGMVVPAGDAAGLAAAWQAVLGWEPAVAGARCRQRILNEFGAGTAALQTAAVLEALL